MHYSYHEIANIFPMMEGEEYEELKKDIAANGLLEPIWIFENKIIDGRNRYKVCQELGIEPKIKEWKGKGSLVSFVISLNLKRRHLTSSQKAMIAVEVEKHLAIEAKERQRLSRGRLHQKAECPDCTATYWSDEGHICNKGSQKIDYLKSAEQAAQIVGTNRQYVADAKRIVEQAPDLAQQVKSGSLSLTEAKRELVKREVKKELVLPSDKYRVFYVDPPWKYGNNGIIGSDNYGHAERHYPAMTIEQLCAMGESIKTMSEDNAVLFLWVTSPLLEECFQVIHSWGFQYKTSFVWDKVKHNFGYYNSVRHELLLVCTKGSCTPESDKKVDSVQTIERSNEHSEKPQAFREIIDTLYPNGKRIELFARTEKTGEWKCWGNQTT